jgi:alkanesulfonate monooxygenase SsuD/methylene tetrahydromethanopterin reductase-like flavin-dependent oxidoreductase (luciferase family)
VYKHFADPFLELAAAVTDQLKIGTSVCLLTEHHPNRANAQGYRQRQDYLCSASE